jgi:hypothetical protein
MKQIPFSSIGEPGKYDHNKAIIYRDGLNNQIFNTRDSYRELQLKNERDRMNEQIAFYMENNLVYDL